MHALKVIHKLETFGGLGLYLMSVTQVKLYCRRCKFERTYQPDEGLPAMCPQCKTEVKPRLEWIKRKVPYLPALVWIILLTAYAGYGMFVVKAIEYPWLPYLMTLAVFGLVWMLATLFLDWPRPHQGPWVMPVVKWPREDASPEEIVGHRVLVRPEEPLHRGKLLASVDGHRSSPHDWENGHDAEDNDRLYIFKLDPESAGSFGHGEYIFFHPEWVRFKRGVQKRLMGGHRGFFHKASMEDLLLNPNCMFKGIFGRLYAIQNPGILTKPALQSSDLKVTAMCSVYRARP